MPKVESVEKCKGDDFKWFLGWNIKFNVLNGFKVENQIQNFKSFQGRNIEFNVLNGFKVEISSLMFFMVSRLKYQVQCF